MGRPGFWHDLRLDAELVAARVGVTSGVVQIRARLPQVAAFFTHVMHHPPEATVLPGKRVHAPCESPDLP